MCNGLIYSQKPRTSVNKYLYNGKELQDDLGLDWYDYGRRMYDPALGRFPVIDRFAERYTSVSPYQYGANNPVLMVDINGDTLFIKRWFRSALKYEDGQLFNKDGSAFTGNQRGFLRKTVAALDEVREGGETGGEMISEIQSSKFHVTVKRGLSNKYDADNTVKAQLNRVYPGQFTSVAGSGGIVRFNPNSSLGGITTRGNRNSQPFIGLAHELGHSLHAIRGESDFRIVSGYAKEFYYDEQFATHIENKVRAENLMPLRTHYGYNETANAGFYRILQPGGQSTFYGNNYYEDLKLKPITTPLPVRAITPMIITK